MKIGSSETTREAPYILYIPNVVIVKHFTFINSIFPEHKKNSKLSFLEWFVGFSEGNANFCSRVQDNRVKLSFEIIQKDAKLMYKIRTMLGFGKVSSFIHTDQIYWKYSVEDKRGLQRIMLLFNGNFVLPKRYEEFLDWVSSAKSICPSYFVVKKQCVQVSLQTGWLAGFIEAKGCFYSHFRAKNTLCLDKFSFDQKLTIIEKNTQGESTVLQQITVLFENARKSHIPKKLNCYKIEFCSLKAHTRIVSYLKQFPLLGQKNITFLRWWRVYLRRYEPQNKNNQITVKTIIKLKKLCSKINEVNYE